jgi:hypothetical protein
MVARHHLDFVLCEFTSTAILAAIELDDKSHGLPSRKRRDQFLDRAFSAAGIPLLRIRAAARYDSKAIAEAIQRMISALPKPAIRGR